MKTTDIKFFRSPSLGHFINPYSRFSLQSFGHGPSYKKETKPKCPKGFSLQSGLNSIVVASNELPKKSRTSWKVSFLFFFISTFLFAQQVNFDAGIIAQKKFFETIPYESVFGKIVIPVEINNKSYRFLLDTGAPNLISKEIYEALNINKLDSILISDANNLVQKMFATNIPKIQLKDLVFENQVALVFDFKQHALLNCFNIDGIIGSNLLKNSILKVSKTEQKIYITDQIKLLQPKSKPAKLKLIGSQKAPYIVTNLVGIGKTKAVDYVLIDTGMDGMYEMSNRVFDAFEKHQIFETLATSTGVSGIGLFGAGEPKEQKLFHVKTAQFAAQTFENMFVNTTVDNNSRIGLDFLDHTDFIIDFKHKKVYFEGKNTVVLTDKAPKYEPTMMDNQFVIGLVWDQNLAQEMKFGDKIISIDNTNINEIDFCDILSLKEQMKDKKNYKIEIKTKEEQIKTIEINND